MKSTKIKELDIDDLIIGEIYHLHDKGGFLIFKFNGKNPNDSARPIADHITDMDGILSYYVKEEFFLPRRHCRIANYEEKCWFLECEKRGKYISKEKIQMGNNYEIY